MKDYLKRLKQHSGWETAIVISVLGFFAGSSNISFEHWWQGGIFGFVGVFTFCLIIILLSNGKPK
jgi:hypothetical protein